MIEEIFSAMSKEDFVMFGDLADSEFATMLQIRASCFEKILCVVTSDSKIPIGVWGSENPRVTLRLIKAKGSECKFTLHEGKIVISPETKERMTEIYESRLTDLKTYDCLVVFDAEKILRTIDSADHLYDIVHSLRSNIHIGFVFGTLEKDDDYLMLDNYLPRCSAKSPIELYCDYLRFVGNIFGSSSSIDYKEKFEKYTGDVMKMIQKK